MTYDFSKADFSQADDVGGYELAPHGTVVMLNITEVEPIKENTNGKKYIPVKFVVADGRYAGKELHENFYLEGKAEPGKKSYALQKTEAFVRYVLETSIQAHTKGKDAYKIASPKNLETGKVAAKLIVDGYFNKEGKWTLTNKVKEFGTPREDSSNYKIYEAWANKTQPWQEPDFKPAEPVVPGRNNAYSGNDSYDHANQDIRL